MAVGTRRRAARPRRAAAHDHGRRRRLLGRAGRAGRASPELLGAEVWGANSSEVNIAAAHPLFRGQLGHMFGEQQQGDHLARRDAVLIVGTYVFPEVFPAWTTSSPRRARSSTST